MNLQHMTASQLEALDPTPDVHALFVHYNELYFDNCLGACSVEWSTSRMTLCAGVCHYSRGGGCRIRLSEPLLKFRPTSDLKTTLLHEMIHAALFLQGIKDDSPDGHGTQFQSKMRAINSSACPDSQRPPGGYNITIYHTMRDEVDSYRTHVWQCSRCGTTSKRSMNRRPQEADCRAYSKARAAEVAAAGLPPGSYCGDSKCWWHSHLRDCGGEFLKVAEPEKVEKAKAEKARASSNTANGSNKRAKSAAGSRMQAATRTAVPAGGAAAAAATAVAGKLPIESYFKNASKEHQNREKHQHQQQPVHGKVQQSTKQQHLAGSEQGSQQMQQPQSGQQGLSQPQREMQQIQQQPVLVDYWAKLGQGRKLASHGTSSSAPTRWMGTELGSSSSVPHAGKAAAAGAVTSPTTHSTAGAGEDRVGVQQLKCKSDMAALSPVQMWLRQHKEWQQQQQQQQLLLPIQHDSQNQQRQPVGSTTDMVELLSSSDAEDEGAPAADKAGLCLRRAASNNSIRAAVGCVDGGRLVSAVLATVDGVADHGSADQAAVTEGQPGDDITACSGNKAVAQGQTISVRAVPAPAVDKQQGLMCPICCLEWLPGQLTNQQLNLHVDECLARMNC